MGCEEFVVRLSTAWSAGEAEGALRARPAIHSDDALAGLPGECHLHWEDRDHIIEIEVASVAPGATVTLRFAICHPSTIDPVFADLVVDLMSSLQAQAVIAEDMPPDEPGLATSFSSSEATTIRRALLRGARNKRALWRSEFGTVEARLSCRDAITRFVIGGGRAGR